MNKKLIAAIIAGIVAVALIVVGIVFVAGDISFGGKGEDKKPASSQSDKEKDPSNQKDENGDNNTVVDKVETNKGKTVEVPVYVSENDGFVGAQIYFEFDTKALSYVGYSNGDLLDECDVNLIDNKIRCILINDDIKNNVKDAGVLVKLKFKINDDAAAGEYKIKLGKETMFADSTEKVITPEVSIAKIDVK